MQTYVVLLWVSFEQSFQNHIEMGIAEADMVSAAGLAQTGKVPFANSFAVLFQDVHTTKFVKL